MYYFIVNEYGKSGYGKREWREIKEELIQRDISHKAYLTESPGHAKKIAQKISRLDEDDITIVVLGGDGTLNEVINGIVDFDKVRVGLIPLGSANDFAKGMGIPNNAIEALKLILETNSFTNIDIGKTKFADNERYFAISSGVGLDALVCKKVENSKLKSALNKVGAGDKSYALITVQSFLSMESINVSVEYEDGSIDSFDKLIFLAGMNMPAEGGGVKMAPEAKPDSGRLVMVCGHDRTKIQAPVSMAKLLMGKHQDSKEFTLKDFSKIVIKSESPLALHTDGEYLGNYTEVEMKCLPAKLKFIS